MKNMLLAILFMIAVSVSFISCKEAPQAEGTDTTMEATEEAVTEEAATEEAAVEEEATEEASEEAAE